MAILSAAGRYKRMPPPSALTKEAGLKNEARTKALGPPYDYQRLKKFNSQQALENPDWRTRPSDNNSSSTMGDDEQTLHGLISAGRQWIGMDASPTTPSAGKNKHQVHLQQATDLSQDGATVNSDLRYNRHNLFALSSEMEPEIVKTLEEEKPVQYDVLKQICLSSSREHPLSLFEVVPVGSMPSFMAPSVVDIRRLKGNLAQRKPGNCQDEQLTAALRAAEATPHKVRVHLSQQSHQEEAQKKYTTPDELRVRKGVFELPQMSTAQRNRTQVRANENRLSPSQTARLVNDRGPMAAFEAERDQAFQRFLKRLGQKNRDLQDEKLQRRYRVDSGYQDGSREDQREGSAETCVLRYRAQGADGRKEEAALVVSVDHQTPGSEISHKDEDASRPVEESSRFKNLNPKAREFLSFVSNPSSNSEDGSMELFQALPADPFAGQGGQANAMSLTGLALPNASSFQQPPPPYGLMPFAAPDAAADPLSLNNLMTGRLIPVPVSTDQFGGQFPTSTLPMPPMPPLSSLLPAMFRPQSVMQSMTGNLLGIPPAPPMLNAAFPLTTGSISPCLNLPCQILPVAGAARPPQPVPKPRRPDPGDQQAYEAWIEWRKANEPGYALECRLRQQRRAQRSITDKAPPKAPLIQKSEASVST